jgi:hypothetical protein
VEPLPAVVAKGASASSLMLRVGVLFFGQMVPYLGDAFSPTKLAKTIRHKAHKSI